MAERLNKTLDPRLRRLVRAIDEPSRLRDDLADSRVTSDIEFPLEAVPPPEALKTRVLVRVRGLDPVAAIPEARWVRIADGIYSAEAALTSLETLAALPQVEFVEAARAMGPLLDTSLPETRADRLHRPPTGLTGAGVVVGIIDFGLDYTLDDFRKPDDTTRVAFLWDQSLTPSVGEHSPSGFGYGVEYTADDIDEALKAADPFSVVRPQPEPESHGTHVAGIAAGNGRSGDATFPAGTFVGAAPEATIVFVQPDTTDEEGSFTDSAHVAEAIAYVFDKAVALGLPCVVNMSLGQNGGSHDGESVVEQAVDRLLEGEGRAFVHAAGNEHVWRGHASGQLATGVTRTLNWKVGGGLTSQLPPGSDRTLNELETGTHPATCCTCGS